MNWKKKISETQCSGPFQNTIRLSDKKKKVKSLSVSIIYYFGNLNQHESGFDESIMFKNLLKQHVFVYLLGIWVFVPVLLCGCYVFSTMGAKHREILGCVHEVDDSSLCFMYCLYTNYKPAMFGRESFASNWQIGK